MPVRQHRPTVMRRSSFNRPRDRRGQSPTKPDPVGETAQRMRARVRHHLCPTGCNIDARRAVAVHFASALLVGMFCVSQRQEKQTRRAFPRIRASAQLRLLSATLIEVARVR